MLTKSGFQEYFTESDIKVMDWNFNRAQKQAFKYDLLSHYRLIVQKFTYVHS